MTGVWRWHLYTDLEHPFPSLLPGRPLSPTFAMLRAPGEALCRPPRTTRGSPGPALGTVFLHSQDPLPDGSSQSQEHSRVMCSQVLGAALQPLPVLSQDPELRISKAPSGPLGCFNDSDSQLRHGTVQPVSSKGRQMFFMLRSEAWAGETGATTSPGAGKMTLENMLTGRGPGGMRWLHGTADFSPSLWLCTDGNKPHLRASTAEAPPG